MYQDILVPTDGSEGSRRAVDHAIDIAATYDAMLHVLFVVDTRSLPADVDAGLIYDALEGTGREAVDEVTRQAVAADVDVEASLATGSVHRAILDYAAEHDVDLVVMGTHGRTGLDRYLLGSVAEKVVRLSPVPVMTVRTDETD